MLGRLFSVLKRNRIEEKPAGHFEDKVAHNAEVTSVVNSGSGMQQVMVEKVQLDYSKYENYVIKPNMRIADVVEKYPQAVAILTEHGIHCVGCHGSTIETLEEGCLGHGMSLSVFDSLLVKLNKATEKKTGGFTITNNTVERVKSLVAKDGRANAFLRLSVVPGGCSGFSYEFKVDDNALPTDIMVERDGAKVVSDPESLNIISGSELDYVDGANGAKFEMKNPNAKSGCGCGSSFGV